MLVKSLNTMVSVSVSFGVPGLENAQYPAAMTAASAAAVPANSARFDRRGGGAATAEIAAAF